MSLSSFPGSLAWKFVDGGDSGETRFDPSGHFIYTTEHANINRYNADGSNPKYMQPFNRGTSTFAISSSNGLHVIAWSQGNNISQTFDGGDSWAKIDLPSDHRNGNGIPALSFAPSNDNIIFAVDSNAQKVWRTLDAGKSWTEVDNGLNWGGGGITGIAVDPSNTSSVYISTDAGLYAPGKVWRTVNSGSSWTDIMGDLPNLPLNTIAIYRTPSIQNPLIFVGADPGVFVSNLQSNHLGQIHWMRYGNGLPDVEVKNLEIKSAIRPASTFDAITAGTYGRGVFVAPIFGPGLGQNITTALTTPFSANLTGHPQVIHKKLTGFIDILPPPKNVRNNMTNMTNAKNSSITNSKH